MPPVFYNLTYRINSLFVLVVVFVPITKILTYAYRWALSNTTQSVRRLVSVTQGENTTHPKRSIVDEKIAKNRNADIAAQQPGEQRFRVSGRFHKQNSTPKLSAWHQFVAMECGDSPSSYRTYATVSKRNQRQCQFICIMDNLDGASPLVAFLCRIAVPNHRYSVFNILFIPKHHKQFDAKINQNNIYQKWMFDACL